MPRRRRRARRTAGWGPETQNPEATCGFAGVLGVPGAAGFCRAAGAFGVCRATGAFGVCGAAGVFGVVAALSGSGAAGHLTAAVGVAGSAAGEEEGERLGHRSGLVFGYEVTSIGYGCQARARDRARQPPAEFGDQPAVLLAP